MGEGNTSNPSSFGYTVRPDGMMGPSVNGQLAEGPAPASFGVPDYGQQAMNPVSSAFNSVMGSNSFGNGGFMSNLPGYALGALSYLDQKKTNKLNRKVTQYGLDRKQTEDAAYDKYKKDWSGMSFKA